MFAVFAFGFALGGLATCGFIAFAPQHFTRMLSMLVSCWQDASWYEKAGLLLLIAPIPGPVDEIVGFLVVRRILARRKRTREALIGGWLQLPTVKQQVAEDTCTQHGKFCCDQCFNMQVVA